MTIQTAPNQQTTLTLRATGYNAATGVWDIKYRLLHTQMDTQKPLRFTDHTVTLRNTEARSDAEGQVVIPADDALDRFILDVDCFTAITELSLAIALEDAQANNHFASYENEMAAMYLAELAESDQQQPWQINERVFPGFRRWFNGVEYVAIMPHTTTAETTPDQAPHLYRSRPLPPPPQSFMNRVKNFF